MALHQVLVVDDSPTIRETVRILLEGEYEVRVLPFQDYIGLAGKDTAPPDLLIIGESDSPLAAACPVASHVPVLWLLRDPAAEPPVMGIPVARAIPRAFSPHQLRSSVSDLLARAGRSRAGDGARELLQAPYLPAEAARVVSEALGNDLPLLLCGEPGTGKSGLARTIHSVRGAGPFLPVHSRAFCAHPLDLAANSGRGTLFVDGIDQLSEDGQQRLLALLEPAGTVRLPGGARMRLVCAAERDLAALTHDGHFSKELYYRLAVFLVRLVPLRERPQDIPDLVRAMARRLAASLGLSGPSFTAPALERLSNYLWFGNLAELEAVLARTLSIRRQATIEADDLLFEHTRLAPRLAAAPEAKLLSTLARELAGQTLDLIINELAHEFKNPMVTIKTFAQHLQRLLHNEADEEEVARLTGEAVDQMDQTLENLLQFTRFDAPARKSVFLGTVLAEPVAELTQSVALQGGHLDYQPPPPVTVVVDPTQAAYGLVNLFRALTRNLPRHGDVVVRYRDPGSILVQVPHRDHAAQRQLSALLDAAANGEPALPLRLAIAKVIIERNGGAVLLDQHTEPATVTVRFTVAEKKKEPSDGDRKASRPDRR